jgi:S-adenosylmethionine-dependent methyltransferase
MAVEDPFAHVAERFIGHYASLRGAVRHVLVSAQVDRHLPAGASSVVDVGGGAGHQSLRLARAGHRVTLVDPSRRMLDEAEAALGTESEAVRSRVRLVHALGEDTPAVLAGERFDVVCCHAVLPYVDDPARLISSFAELARPAALLSLLFKNADALAMRAALEQRWADAVDAFGAHEDVGALGAPTAAHRLHEVRVWLADAGFSIDTWYGVRVFSDHLHDLPIEAMDDVLPAEAEASQRDPYRSLGRLLHVIAHSTGGRG